jgi:hypothetical protein
MSVEKFRSADEARLTQRSIPGSPENLRRLHFVLEFWSRVHPRVARPGVFKYRSIAEANQDIGFSRR